MVNGIESSLISRFCSWNILFADGIKSMDVSLVF